ncbi:malonyl-CoA-acyl carrier protein transacylase, mitochondrial-like [Macrochelys suwanniensis]
MGRGLLRYPNVRHMFRVAEKVLGYDLLSLCLRGPPAELDRTLHCQPAVFVASLAAIEKLHHQQPSVGYFLADISKSQESLTQVYVT